MEHKVHGGAREGSGRKKMAEEDKKKRVTYILSPDVIEFIKESGGSRYLEKLLKDEMDKKA